MQKMLAIILIALMVCIGIAYWKIGSIRDVKNRKKLRRLMLSNVWILISEIAILLLRGRQPVFMAFTSYYIAIGWFIFFGLSFCILHSGYEKLSCSEIPLFVLTTIETIAIIWAYFNKGLFTVTHSRWLGHSMWISRRFDAFYVYTAISIGIVVATLIVLFSSAVRSAKIYRLKYTSSFSILLCLTAYYAYCQIKELPIVLPIIMFTIGVLVVTYMSVYYAPKKLVQKALLFVADELNDGIILYDDSHNLQFVTDGFRQAFGLSDEKELEDEEKFRVQFLENTRFDKVWNGRIKAVEHEESISYYDIHSMTFDEKGRVVGTVYWIHDVSESIDKYRQMVYRANFDELTGIYNEKHFHEMCRQLLNNNPDVEFIMICIAVERFKVFRDLFGMEKVNEFLTEIAQALKNSLPNVPMCHYGKDESDTFYIIMPKDSFIKEKMLADADGVVDKMSTSNYRLSVKFGIYDIKDPSLKLTSICNRAYMAYDSARGDYHKKIVWYNENIQRDAMLTEHYNAELSNAIENGEIQIYLQPQTDSNGNVLGAEALARWIHKEEGIIPPVCFVPSFEKNGRITELDVCVWKQACQKLKEWKEKGRTDLYISVNISAKDLYALNIYDHYMGLIDEYGISPRNLKLEITESAIVNDLKQQLVLIERLQEAGFEVEMDDFGSAYSSFNMLKDICVDVLKIDMKFLGETENVERSRIILKSIVDLSKELKMKTVAEGVETEEQLEFLRTVGCDIYQGYYFSKPISSKDFDLKYL